MSRFIEIADDNEVFDYPYRDPATKVLTGTVFGIRVLTPDFRRALEQKHTTQEFVRGQRIPIFNADSYVREGLDYAVVRWSGVRKAGEELPCNPFYKDRLPESVRTELVRLCFGRELGDIIAEARGEKLPEGPDAAQQDPSSVSDSSATGSETKAGPRPVAN